jgi:hypothetical protein
MKKRRDYSDSLADVKIRIEAGMHVKKT